MAEKFYKSINDYSGSVYRLQAYYTTDATYTIEYYCEATADAALASLVRRIKRVRYVTATGKLFDTCRAINTTLTKRSDYNKGTSAFIFPATSLAVVGALTYNAT